jgi:peroxiredoxin
MKRKKHLLLLIVLFQILLINAQKYTFISKDLHEMTNEEMMKYQVRFSSNIDMFDAEGNKIKDDQINNLMTSGHFMPIIFANKAHKPKAIVFRKATDEEKQQMKAILEGQDPNQDFVPGLMAEDFTTEDINGNTIKLSDLKGKIVVINFWFSHCQPCVAEMPELNKLVEKYKSKDIVFISITFDDKEKVEKFLSNTKFNYTPIVGAMTIIQKYNVNSFPSNLIIDKKGEIIYRKIGAFVDELDFKIATLLKEK